MVFPTDSSNLPQIPTSDLATFEHLQDVPPEAEWFANIRNPQTRRAYKNDLQQFMARWQLSAHDLRHVKRAHVLQWRRELEQAGLAGTTIRRKLAALSSLFRYLCENQAVETNPVSNIQRPACLESRQGKTPALGDDQARRLLAAPSENSLLGLRDKAILSVLLYHGLRRAELCALRVADLEMRRGVTQLHVRGKGSKLRFIPLHPDTAELIHRYLELAGHGQAKDTPLFQALHTSNKEKLAGLSANSVYVMVKKYAEQIGVEMRNFGPHSLRATAATNALENGAGLEMVQDWLGHADPATTRVYDHRNQRPADSPTFKVRY